MESLSSISLKSNVPSPLQPCNYNRHLEAAWLKSIDSSLGPSEKSKGKTGTQPLSCICLLYCETLLTSTHRHADYVRSVFLETTHT